MIGHLRRAAGKSIGLTECPVHVASELTPQQIRGLRLADNRTNQESVWDEELLSRELQELAALDFDLSLTGFDPRELEDLLTLPDNDEQADVAPPLPENPVSRLGDLWLLAPAAGKVGGLTHRVICGDATSIEDTSRLLGGQKAPFMMACDPPYSVELDPNWRVGAGLQHRSRQFGKVANDDRTDWSAAYALFPGDVAYVWHAGVHAAEVAAGLHSSDFQIRAQIIWKKQRFVISRGAYHWGHEPCWYAVRKGRPAHWRGDRTQSTVWEVDNLVTANRGTTEDDPENSITGHGTQKPVELFRRPILNHTETGDAVYDCFLGSGSCLIAAQTTGRICYGIDIDPKYVDCAVTRWQNLTGAKATLDGDGRTFDEIAQERQQVAV